MAKALRSVYAKVSSHLPEFCIKNVLVSETVILEPHGERNKAVYRLRQLSPLLGKLYR